MGKVKVQSSPSFFLLLAAIALALTSCSPEEVVEEETYPGASETGRTKPFGEYAEIDKRTLELREKQPIYFLAGSAIALGLTLLGLVLYRRS